MNTIVARGRILWDSVYEPYEDKLRDKLSSYHPDFMCEFIFFAFLLFCFFASSFYAVRDHSCACVLFRVRLPPEECLRKDQNASIPPPVPTFLRGIGL